jgi:hypothetical protein
MAAMRLVLPIFVSLLLAACGGVQGTARITFDQPEMNQTWYGAYHRPMADADASRAPRARPARSGRDAPAPTAVATRPTAPSAPTVSGVAADGYDAETAAAYVRDIYGLNETPIGEGRMQVVDVYRFVHEHGQIYHSPRPAVGDLVFFHNTHDMNQDARPNDWYSHVGIVEGVSEDDTVTVLSWIDGEVGRIQLNRSNPSEERLRGETVNTRLRDAGRDDPEHAQYLAGELFAGFGSLLGERTQVVVLDVWRPEDSPSLRASR